MRMKYAALVAGLALGLMSGTAKAAYTLNINQSGPNVVETGSGSIDLSAFFAMNTFNFGTDINPNETKAAVGEAADAQVYQGEYFGSYGADVDTQPSSSTGNYVGFDQNDLLVPVGYETNTPLGISTATFNNTTLAALGLTPGTSFTFQFFTDGGTDAFIINVGMSPVPLPASAPMFGAALLALGAVGYGLKRKKSAAAA